jgi:NAD(P)-dependent dehydrogenase (short-subunit alcohol dehydrogenase family)
MDLGIAGRKAIVCASSRGLGRACAQRLAEAGCEVVINGLNRERLEATAAEIRKQRVQRSPQSRPTWRAPTARRRCLPPARSPTSW